MKSVSGQVLWTRIQVEVGLGRNFADVCGSVRKFACWISWETCQDWFPAIFARATSSCYVSARQGKNYYSGQDDRQERVIDASHPPRRGFLDHTIATFNTTSSARELDILTSILIAKETTPNKSLSDDPAFAPGNPVTENFFLGF